jgi:hypothetical protein
MYDKDLARLRALPADRKEAEQATTLAVGVTAPLLSRLS